MRLRFETGFAVMAAVTGLVVGHSHAAIVGPYSADSDTLLLYHFDEMAGGTTSGAGNPVLNYGSLGVNLDLTKTGGPTGRGNNTTGGYGATPYTGFGSAFNVPLTGNATAPYHTSQSSSGGGLVSRLSTSQSSLMNATSKAFSYEALIQLSTLGNTSTLSNQVIFGHDGPSGLQNNARGPTFRIVNSTTSGGAALSLFNGNGGAGAANPQALIPLVGDNAYDPNAWFHVAVTFSGTLGQADNIKFYWTKLDANATTANLIGTATLSTSQAFSGNTVANTVDGGTSTDLNDPWNYVGIGTDTRGLQRFELQGLVDEVRVSSVARTADQFIFTSVPEPALASVAAAGLLMMRRRSRK